MILKKKGIAVISLLFSLVAFIAGGNCATGAEDENVITIANGEWPPFISENLKHHGVVCHIITEAFALEGVTVVYEWVPWKRAFVLTERGKYDATASWVPTPERKEKFHFSNTFLRNQKVFFHMKSKPFDWKTIDDLKGLKIGGVLGYTYGEAFDKAVEEGILRLERTPTEIQNFKKLQAGRIDIYPQEKEIGYGNIRAFPENEASQFTHHPKPLMETTHHLIFSKKVEKNERLIKLFNKGLNTLKESGKMDAYYGASREGEYEK